MTKFLRPLTDLLNQTFNKSAVNMSGANKAFAENKKAVTGAYLDFAIDYLIAGFSGKPVQSYISFMSADGKKVSTSLFTGAVNVL